MRYGKIVVTRKEMAELLCLTTQEVHRTRIGDMPDDIEIIAILANPLKETFEILLKGSGAPLKKVPVGGEIPVIHIVFEDEKGKRKGI